MKKYILLIFIMASCSKGPKPGDVNAAAKAPDAISIRVATVEKRIAEKSISVTGTLNADESVMVSSEVAGRITKINADFGQAVHKGDVVAELDQQEFQWQLDRSRSALAQALARLGLTPEQGANPPRSTAAMRQAEAQLEDAKSKFESASKLVKTGDVAQERYTEMEKAYRARQAALDGVRDDLLTQWAAIQALRAEVSLAEKHKNDAIIRAPFDGVVASRAVSAGQYMKENTPIVTLVKTYPLRLRLDVPEAGSVAVHIGTTLVFTTDAIPNAEFRAIVREINPTLDSKSRTLSAEARLVTPDMRLRPGMFVQVKLITSPRTEVIAVPKEAIYSIAGLTKLFVIEHGKAKEIRFVQGMDLGTWAEAPADAVKPGDTVAVSNLPLLSNGVEVKQ